MNIGISDGKSGLRINAFLLLLLIITTGSACESERQLEITSPLTYTPYITGQEIVATAKGGRSSEQTEWTVVGTDYSGSGMVFKFTPEVSGNYVVIASNDNIADTIKVLVRSGKTESVQWTNVNLVNPMEGFIDLFGYQKVFVFPDKRYPVITESETLNFRVGQPVGSNLLVQVKGNVVDSLGNIKNSYKGSLNRTFENSTLQIVEVPLVPDAVNRIRFQGLDEEREDSAPVTFTINHIKAQPNIPIFFQQANEDPPDISEEELEENLESFIDNAEQVSRELAEHLDEVVLHDGDRSRTDRETGRIRIAREELRRTLRRLQEEDDPEARAQIEEEIKREYVNLLLHEAGHSKVVSEGGADESTPEAEEEIRNITELINRMIDLLDRLNERLSGDPPTSAPDGNGLDDENASTWFDRIMHIIFRQMEYIQKYLYREDQEFRQAADELRDSYAMLQSELQDISEDGSLSDEEKQEQAQDLFDNFEEDLAEELETITEKSGKVYEFTLNPETFSVGMSKRVSNSFRGNPIPPKEE